MNNLYAMNNRIRW